MNLREANRKLAVAALTVISLAMITVSADAQLLEEKMTVTFSGPVELPGRVLPAGSYVFSAVEPNVTRITSADMKMDYGTYITVPEERQEPADKATIVLREKPTENPQRLDAWFYPGESIGNEFMYSPHSSHHQSPLASSEFIGRHAERVIVDSGTAVVHAVKSVLS